MILKCFWLLLGNTFQIILTNASSTHIYVKIGKLGHDWFFHWIICLHIIYKKFTFFTDKVATLRKVYKGCLDL